MNCVNCGKSIKPTARICLSCGTQVNPVSVTLADHNPQSVSEEAYPPVESGMRPAPTSSPPVGDYDISSEAHELSPKVPDPITQRTDTYSDGTAQSGNDSQLESRRPQYESATKDIFIKGSIGGSFDTPAVGSPTSASASKLSANASFVKNSTKLSMLSGIVVLAISLGFFLSFSVDEGSSDRDIRMPESSSTTESSVSITTPMSSMSEIASNVSRSELNALLQMSAANDWSGVGAKTNFFKLRDNPGDVLGRVENEEGIKAIREGNFDKAITHFQRAVAANSEVAEYANNLGFAYLKNGQLDESKEAFLNTLLLDPSRAICWLNVSELFAMQGNIDGGRSAMKLAIFFASDRQKAIGSIERISQTQNGSFVKSVWELVEPEVSYVGRYIKDAK